MKISCVIFDFDGTLFDSMHVWDDVGRRYLASLGITANDDFEETIAGMTLAQGCEYASKTYPIHKTPMQVLEGISAIVKDDYAYRIEPKAGVKEILETLHHHNVRMIIATASDQRLVMPALKRCHMDHYFIDIVSAQDSKLDKHSPDIFEKAMHMCQGDKTDTVVIEDAYHAAFTAKKAGFTVIGVYDESEKQQNKMQEVCDIYVHTLAEWKVEEML